MSSINKEKQAAVPQKVLHKLFDYDEVSGVWTNKVNRNSRARVGQTAGSLDKSTGYVQIGINGHYYQAHRLAWVYVYGDYPDGEQPYIDHINGIRNDNRIVNLKISSHGENMKNQKMKSNNSSGVTGVHHTENVRPSGKIDSYWVARWQDENGKRRFKSFPIHTYGEEVAKQMAIDHRAEQLLLLEVSFGIKYSERHGMENNLHNLVREQIDLNAGVSKC